MAILLVKRFWEIAPSIRWILFVLISLGLMIWRQPELLLEPRLWAEEGHVYLVAALKHGWWSIFMPHQGYYSLLPNLSAYVASLVKLEYAPWAFIVNSVFWTLGLWFYAFFGQFSYIRSKWQSFVQLLLVIFIAANGEVWLNTINLQFVLFVLSFLVLHSRLEEQPKRHYFAKIFLLSVATLSGVLSNFLAPLYFLKFLSTKNKRWLGLGVILIIGSIFQLLAIAYSKFYLPESISRFNLADFLHLKWLSPYIKYMYVYPYWASSLHWVERFPLTIVAITLSLLALKKHRILYINFLFASLAVGAFSVMFSMHMRGGVRYAFAPAILLNIFLATAAFQAKNKKLSMLLTTILLFSLVQHIPLYKYNMEYSYQKEWPKWKQEVAKWRIDPSYSPIVHPYPRLDQWHVKISQNSRKSTP